MNWLQSNQVVCDENSLKIKDVSATYPMTVFGDNYTFETSEYLIFISHEYEISTIKLFENKTGANIKYEYRLNLNEKKYNIELGNNFSELIINQQKVQAKVFSHLDLNKSLFSQTKFRYRFSKVSLGALTSQMGLSFKSFNQLIKSLAFYISPDRFILYKNTFRMLKDSYIYGIGLNNWDVVYPLYREPGEKLETSAHSDLLQLVIEIGLPCSFIVVGCSMVFIFKSYRASFFQNSWVNRKIILNMLTVVAVLFLLDFPLVLISFKFVLLIIGSQLHLAQMTTR